MIVEQYLQCKVLPNFTFSDDAIQAAMLPIKRYNKLGIEPNSDIKDVKEMELDLAMAELWDMAAGLLNGGGNKISMGNRSKTDMSIQTSQNDRQVYRNIARELRARWGIKIVDVTNGVFDCTNLWGAKR